MKRINLAGSGNIKIESSGTDRDGIGIEFPTRNDVFELADFYFRRVESREFFSRNILRLRRNRLTAAGARVLGWSPFPSPNERQK